MHRVQRAPALRARTRKAVSIILLASIACLAALSLSDSAFAATRSTAAKPSECIGVAKGLPWSKNGKKGTAYTVIGVSGASCTLGSKWLLRITRSHSAVVAGPPGWSCIVASPSVGECTTKAGGIFEWTPKLT